MDINLQTPGLMLVNLKPGEIFYSERGAMAFMDSGIDMKPVDIGLINGIKRMLAGESFFSIVKYANNSNVIKSLKLRYDIQNIGWFQSNVTDNKLEAINLVDFKEDLIIDSGAFFAGTSLQVDMLFDKNIYRSILGSGSIFSQRIRGNGILFIKKNRWMQLDTIHVNSNNSIKIDPKEIYAFPYSSLIKSNASMGNFFAGEGFSMYEFIGPAKIMVYKTNHQDYKGCILKIGVLIFLFFILKLFLSLLF